LKGYVPARDVSTVK